MKKIASISIIFTFLLMPLPAGAFNDVTEKDPYYQAVKYFEDLGIISTGKKFFYPASFINRAEFLKMTWNIAGYKAKKNEKGFTQYKDVPHGSWFAPYVKKSLTTNGISFSAKSTYFNPNSHIDRIEALETIFQTQGIGTTKVFTKQDLPFTDINTTSPYAHIAKTALEFGLFKNEKKFQGHKKVTKAEAADWMHKIQEKLKYESDRSVQVIQLVTQTPGDTDSENFIKNPKFRLLVDVWGKAHHRYVYGDKINDDDLIYAAIEGMTNQMGDKYTTFQKPKNAKGLTQQLSGQFDGIGVSIDLMEGKITIISPLKGSPAEKAGLKPNDIITKIDGKVLENITLEGVANMIKGTKGTKVLITINRAGKEMQFDIAREHITIASVQGYMKNGIAVIELRSFGQTTYKEFMNQLKPLLAQNPQGIIIDVRNNPGGYLNTALQILDHFLSKGTKISTLAFSSEQSAKMTFEQAKVLENERVSNANPLEVEYNSLGQGELSKYKIVIIQNKGSASAAEILTAALKDNMKSSVVGDTSFGKGSVQELIDYSDGSLLKISIAKWLTPSGINLTHNPIPADYIMNDNPDTQNDEALDKALSLFN